MVFPPSFSFHVWPRGWGVSAASRNENCRLPTKAFAFCISLNLSTSGNHSDLHWHLVMPDLGSDSVQHVPSWVGHGFTQCRPSSRNLGSYLGGNANCYLFASTCLCMLTCFCVRGDYVLYVWWMDVCLFMCVVDMCVLVYVFLCVAYAYICISVHMYTYVNIDV